MADKKTVDSWMEELDPSLREIAQTLRGLILQAVPDISESIKWGAPNYARGAAMSATWRPTRGISTWGSSTAQALTTRMG